MDKVPFNRGEFALAAAPMVRFSKYVAMMCLPPHPTHTHTFYVLSRTTNKQ